MAFKVYVFTFMFVNIGLRGVLNQIDISPKPTAVVNVGEDLTMICRTSITWNTFSYILNGVGCFLTFGSVDPCRAQVISCPPLQSYSYHFSCDKIHFNLTITNVPRSMQNTAVSGSLAYNGSSTLQTDTVTIQVNVPLKEVTLDPNGMLTLVKGETKQLTCSAKSIPQSTFTWSIDNSPVSSTLLPGTDDDTVTSTYRYTARKDDNGKTLTCTASYGSVAYTDNVTLNIQYLPSVEVKPSDFKPYKVIENTTDLQLRCSVNDTNPVVTSYRWYVNNSIIPTTTAYYTISTVQKSNAGDYSCDANNTVGTSLKSTEVKLDVLFGITMNEMGKREVESNSKLNVTCTGQSNPPIADSNANWTKQNNNTFTQLGKQLILTNINKADKGVYICTVDITLIPSIGSNVRKSASTLLLVDVVYLPSVEVKPSDYKPYKVIENTTDLQLRCSVIDSNPVVTSYRWYVNDSLTPTTTANYTIFTVRRSDAADYSCAANNNVGTSLKSSDVKLEVLFGITLDNLDQQKVNSGSKLDVTCTGQSNPPITDDNVIWTKQNNNSFTMPGRHLIITNINIADKGVFICTVKIMLKPSNGLIVKKSATTLFTVDVLYLPTVEVIPSDYNPYKVVENVTSLQLRCSVMDSNPMVTSYRWYMNDVIIQTTTANYTISTVQRSDAGDYSCDATNSVGVSSRSMDVKLDVLYGILVDVIENLRINESELLEMNCTGQSNPAVSFDNVQWTKEGNITFRRRGNLLKIDNVDRMDNGSFVCSINISLTPSVGKQIFVSNSTSTQIVVYYAPSVNIIPSRTNLTVLENSTNIVLNCNVTDSYPDATNFIWFKNEERLFHHNSIYNISQVKKSDSGMYTCAATNIAGQSKQSPGVLLTALYGVSLNISTTQIRVNETEQWSVFGKADGNPLPTFNWIYTHNDSEVQPLSISLKESSITVNNANCQDSGRYIVIGNNGIGKDVSRSFDVQIICAPREVLNRRLINVFINESDLHLEAVFIAFPTPNISWSLMANTTELGSEYNISTLESEFPYKTSSILSKVNSKQLDRGKYYAIAVNERGSQTVTFNIANKDTVQNLGSDSPSVMIGGISGAAGSIFVAVAVILTLYLIRRRKHSGNKRENLVGKNKHTDEENDDYSLKDNPLYGDSKAVHSGVVSTNGDNKGEVTKFKSKLNENNKDMVYENSAVFLELDDSHHFANLAENIKENRTKEQRKVINPNKNKDGLIYADLDFDQSKKNFVIHGLENKTNYAFIDLTQSAVPLTSSDEDEVNDMK